MIPDEGLLPQLEEGLSLFYAGLSALSAAQGQGLDEVPDVTRDLVVDGIPVTVTDTVDSVTFGGVAGGLSDGVDSAGGGEAAGGAVSSSSKTGPRLMIEVVDDAAAAAVGGGDDTQEEEQREAEPLHS